MDGATSSDHSKKRKHPPTFPHLHPSQAQKLKRSWVEKKKIQRAYHTQKKRDGFRATGANKAGDMVGVDEGWPRREVVKHNESEELEEVNVLEENQDRPTKKSKIDKTPNIPRSHSQRNPSDHRGKPGGDPLGKSQESRSQPQDKAQRAQKEKMEPSIEIQAPKIRDLVKEAYGPSSLHTFKSNPLHRRKLESGSRSNIQGRHREKSSHGSFYPPKRRTGQPNMKLRMGALLEQIKRSKEASES